MGKVGPVMLKFFLKVGVAKPNSLFKYLTNAPIVILAMQNATMNHVGDDCFEIIPILNFLSLEFRNY